MCILFGHAGKYEPWGGSSVVRAHVAGEIRTLSGVFVGRQESHCALFCTPMADETAEKQQKRVPGRPFKPGESGNPNGRPKKGETVSDAIREFGQRVNDDGSTAREAVAEKLYALALKRNDQVGLGAIKYIADRWEGTPRQTMDHSGTMDFRILLPGDADADD